MFAIIAPTDPFAIVIDQQTGHPALQHAGATQAFATRILALLQ